MCVCVTEMEWGGGFNIHYFLKCLHWPHVLTSYLAVTTSQDNLGQ